MSAKYFSDQLDNEELLLVFKKHPIVMRKGLILAMFALLFGTIPSLIRPEYSYLFWGLGIGFVVALIVFFPSWISWYYSVFIVTDQRLIQIQMVNYEVAGLQQTMLGFGTIMMQTFVGDLVIHDVHRPAKVQKQLLTILREQGVVAANPPVLNIKGQDEEKT